MSNLSWLCILVRQLASTASQLLHPSLYAKRAGRRRQHGCQQCQTRKNAEDARTPKAHERRTRKNTEGKPLTVEEIS